MVRDKKMCKTGMAAAAASAVCWHRVQINHGMGWDGITSVLSIPR